MFSHFPKLNSIIVLCVGCVGKVVYAADSPLSVQPILYRIYYAVINPLITLGFAIALLYFMYGVVDFLRKRDMNAADASEGKNHLMYGLIGLFIMVSAFAIMSIMNNIWGGTAATKITTP